MRTAPFDAAKYLGSREAQAALFSDALESGDPGYIAAALGTIARARGMTQVAEEAGLSRPALYAPLREGEPLAGYGDAGGEGVGGEA